MPEETTEKIDWAARANNLSHDNENFLYEYAGAANEELPLEGKDLTRYRAVLSAKFGLELPGEETFEDAVLRLTRDEHLTVYAEYWTGAVEGIKYKIGIAHNRMLMIDDIPIDGVAMNSSFLAALYCAEAQMRLRRAYGD